MNSDSKLRYATQFVGKERRVFLEGEAYFEVAPDAKKPFLVETRNQTLQVLGTKFNISAYTNEIITTTLVQGCVNLTNSTTMLQQQLVPGEQAFIDSKSNKWQVKKVDVEDVIAWTKGMFVFNDQSLEQVMGKLERWYDVKVVYSDEAAKKIVFKGNLPRNLDLKTVLSMIERISSASFDMQENQVNVKVK
jgi:ferric-dicitrate binding protein FerR (iron transport regulator)